MSSNPSCEICSEVFTRKSRCKVDCPSCQGSACKDCWKNWLIESSEEKCMYPECGNMFSRKWMAETFPKSFLTGQLKRHRENVYFEREQSLLPATQPRVQEIIRDEKRKEIHGMFANDIKRIRERFNQGHTDIIRRLSTVRDGLLILNAKGEEINNSDKIRSYWNSDVLGPFGSEKEGKPQVEFWQRVYVAGRLIKRIRGAALIKLLPISRALRSGEHIPDYFYLAMLVAGRGGSFSNSNALEWRRYHRASLEPNRLLYTQEMTAANERHRQRMDAAGFTRGTTTDRTPVVHRFTRACMKGDCRGYINTAFKCGLCETVFCKECHAIDTEDHICKEDDVATAKLIMSDTKPCPGCSISVHKIDGCNQMWCTQCKTAWDWKTGSIQKKVHNPHYFEYLRNMDNGAVMARNPNEVRCGREFDVTFTHSLSYIMRRHQITSATTVKVTSVIAGMNEMDFDVTRNLGDSPDTEDLRVDFIRNKLNVDAFKRRVQAKHKKWHKDIEIRDLLVMFKQTIIDIMYRYRYAIDISETTEEAEGHGSILDEIDVLQEYVNNQLLIISKTYQSKPKAVRVNQRVNADGDHQQIGLYTI